MSPPLTQRRATVRIRFCGHRMRFIQGVRCIGIYPKTASAARFPTASLLSPSRRMCTSARPPYACAGPQEYGAYRFGLHVAHTDCVGARLFTAPRMTVQALCGCRQLFGNRLEGRVPQFLLSMRIPTLVYALPCPVCMLACAARAEPALCVAAASFPRRAARWSGTAA